MRITKIKAALTAGLALALCACADQKPREEAPVDVAMAQYVLDDVPSDVPHRTFIDFEGKVHLVGWNIEPADKVGPGQKLKLTLYWKSVARLGPGWRLFTHLVAPGGVRLANPDDVGPLRASMQPSAWKPGKVYVDVQDLEMPRDLWVPEVALTVGIWRDKSRLDVISGPSDNERRAIVTHIKTGVVPSTQAATAANDQPQPPPGQLPMRPPMARPNLAPPSPAERPAAPVRAE